MRNGKLTDAGRAELKKGRRSKSKKTKMTPAVRYLRYEITTSGSPNTETSFHIDLARDLSRVNRRLYRQGRDYHVKKVTIVSSNTPTDPATEAARVSMSTAPDGWVTREAWKRGFRIFNHMQKDAMVNAGNDLRSTWNDFKVQLSPGSPVYATGPLDNGGNTFATGEWLLTDFITPDGTTGAEEFYTTLLGDHIGAAGARTSVGLIKSYGESRTTVQADDPNVQPDVANDPLVNVFDYGTGLDEVLEKAITEGDAPPYALNQYPGDNANAPKPIVVQDTTIVDGRAILGGFNAICGLLEIEAKSPVPSDTISILVELAPGKYRGIKAEVI